jgi:nucleotide-binding universal stress UspA family protein
LSQRFKKILVAVAGYKDPATRRRDGKRETVIERNIGCACNLAKLGASRLFLIHVISLPIVISADFGVVPTKPYEDAGRRIIENARMIAKGMGVEAGTILERCYGNPAQKIIQVAEDGKFDLITISSREHSRLHKVLLGSVCDTVTRNAPCPVLVVR